MKCDENNSLQNLTVAQAGNVVRVSLPVSAHYKLDTFQKVQKHILGRLGCVACCSGWDIRWGLQRNFLIDEKLNIRVDEALNIRDAMTRG